MIDEIEYFEVDETKDFQKKVDRFVKKKNFRKLPNQVNNLIDDLEQGKFDGTLLRTVKEPVEHDIYKLRMPNEDTKEGKSNGYRVIYAVTAEQKLVLLVDVYYKKEENDVTESYVSGLIDCYFLTRNNVAIAKC